MAAALADLHAPFSQLVGVQLQRSSPWRCAAFVLTAGSAGDPADNTRADQADPQAHRKRIDLAAAIEVLRLALAVHTQLLPVTGDDDAPNAPLAPVDRSLLGSTILAGDYCFSRAAALAARTGSPAVVDIFAQALQRVSEGTLRGLFRTDVRAGAQASPPAAGFGVERELCLAGVQAAGELAELDAAQRQADQQAALLLLDARHGEQPADWPAQVSPARRPRWRALRRWLAAAGG